MRDGTVSLRTPRAYIGLLTLVRNPPPFRTPLLMKTNFRTWDIPTKFPGHPRFLSSKTHGRQTFKGEHDLFGPTPSRGRAPPHWVWVPFPIQMQIIAGRWCAQLWTVSHENKLQDIAVGDHLLHELRTERLSKGEL